MTSRAKTPFCKVCFDAKKSKDEYTSHWVKSQPGPKGVVVCPYLLSLDCRYCKGKGHTPRGCPVLRARQAARVSAQEPTAQEPAAQEPAAQEPAAQEPAAQEPAAQELEPELEVCEDFITFRRPNRRNVSGSRTPTKRRVNSFDGLSQCSDSEDGYHQETGETLPEPLNWASIAAKPPVPLKRSQVSHSVSVGLSEEVDSHELPALAPDDDAFLRNTATGQKISWADYCDSD
jgi:hypothetical protein